MAIKVENLFFLLYFFVFLNLVVPTYSIAEESFMKIGSNLAGQSMEKYSGFRSKSSIKSFSKQFFLDGKSKSCDVLINEQVEFNFPNETNVVHHLIISKKNPLYGFGVTAPINSSIGIRKVEIYQDKSLRDKFYYFNIEKAADRSRMYFRDRWLISVLLDRPVSKITLNFSYYDQRAIAIDQENKKNLMKLYLVNPYPFDINNLKVQIYLLNFQQLKKEDLTIPVFSSLKRVNMSNTFIQGEGFKISIKKNLPKKNEFFMNMILPMEVITCETKLVQVVYYSLVGMTAGFILISFAVVYFLYKE